MTTLAETLTEWWDHQDGWIEGDPTGLGIDHRVDWNVVVAKLKEHPADTLEAIGAEAVLDWIDKADGFGFVVEYLKATARAGSEYYEGVKDGIRAHAIYSNGEQVVGALRKPLKQVLADVDRYEALGDRWVF